jgi:hypothetical protein
MERWGKNLKDLTGLDRRYNRNNYRLSNGDRIDILSWIITSK